MVESATEYADRVLDYCLKATKQIPLNDSTLKRDIETPIFVEPEPKPEVFAASFNELYKARFTGVDKTDSRPTVTEYLDTLMKDCEKDSKSTKR